MYLKRLLIVLLVAFTITGCAFNSSKKDSLLPEASNIAYSLPETRARIDLTLTLETCTKDPAARASLTITPVATASSDSNLHFRIRGKYLQAILKANEVKIDLYPHGAIKSVNSSSTDATATVIGGIIKLAGLAATAPFAVPVESACNADTLAAIDSRDKLRKNLESIRTLLKSPGNEEKLMKRVTAITHEIARLETGPLQIKLQTVIGFDKRANNNEIIDGGIIKWNASRFNKWITHKGTDKKIDNFSLTYCVKPIKPGITTSCALSDALDKQKYLQLTDTVKCINGTNLCSNTLVFRDPVPAQLLIATARRDDYVNDKTSLAEYRVIGRKNLLIAQWGEYSYLPISVGFGGKKTVSFTLDEYGRKTKFGWASGARGAEIINGLTSIAETAQTTKATLDSEETQSMKAKVTELETLQKLNKLEKCRSIIENGGFVCPEE